MAELGPEGTESNPIRGRILNAPFYYYCAKCGKTEESEVAPGGAMLCEECAPSCNSTWQMSKHVSLKCELELGHDKQQGPDEGTSHQYLIQW